MAKMTKEQFVNMMGPGSLSKYDAYSDEYDTAESKDNFTGLVKKAEPEYAIPGVEPTNKAPDILDAPNLSQGPAKPEDNIEKSVLEKEEEKAADPVTTAQTAVTTPGEIMNYGDFIQVQGLSDGAAAREQYKKFKENLGVVTPEPGNIKAEFWDELYNKTDDLKAAGLDMYGYGSDKATPEELTDLINQNPLWMKEFVDTGKVTINPKSDIVDEIPEDEPKVNIPDEKLEVEEVEKEPVIENDVDETITEVVKDKGWMSGGKIDWGKISELAQDTGRTVAEVLQGAMAGYMAGKQGRALTQEETITGRRDIQEEQQRLAAEQEESQIAAEERQYDMATKLKQLDNIENEVQRKYQDERDKVARQFEIDQDETARKNNLEIIKENERSDINKIYASKEEIATTTEDGNPEDILGLNNPEISM